MNIKVGDIVRVTNVRSNHLDHENGIGWTASNVNVVVDRVNDITFCFWFNKEYHYELQSECRPSTSKYSLRNEYKKIEGIKNNIDYRLKSEYGIQ